MYSHSAPCNIYNSSFVKRACLFRRDFLTVSAQLPQTIVSVFISLGGHLKIYLKDHAMYDQDPKIYGKPRRVSLLVDEAQRTGCLKVWVSGRLK